jgi:hypothetical protein
MAVPIQSRQRVESPERWQKALERAMEANLAYIELIGGDGAWAVSSRQDCERGYIATTRTCTCEAGRGGDPVCCHRALVRALTGTMVVEAETAECLWCCGTGQVPNDYHERYDRCDRCNGTGITSDHRLHDAPVQPMVATIAA